MKTVRFNRDVDFSKVIVTKTVKVDCEMDHNADGFITLINPREIEWTSTKNYHDLLDFDPDGNFKLILIGSDKGYGVIKDVNGNVLDGDSNGAPGGDFKHIFTLIG